MVKPISMFRRVYNQQTHMHLTGCNCRIDKQRYEFEKTFNTYREAQLVWEIKNDYGTKFHNCLLNFIDSEGRKI